MFNYSYYTDHPGLVRVLREILSLLGCHAYTYPPVYQSEHQPQSDRYNERVPDSRIRTRRVRGAA